MYNIYDMPLSNNEKIRNAQTKAINGVPLSLTDKMILGRDVVVREVNDYKLKPDCVYRAINEELLEIYKESGFIIGSSIDDEYKEYEEDGKTYNNNKGVDWYLGGVCLKYGDIILECPASKEFFRPSYDNGSGMSLDPMVRFMKSSGYENPVPIDMISNIIFVNKKKSLDETKGKNI